MAFSVYFKGEYTYSEEESQELAKATPEELNEALREFKEDLADSLGEPISAFDTLEVGVSENGKLISTK